MKEVRQEGGDSMDELDRELDEMADALSNVSSEQVVATRRLPPPRRDPMALGFGVAFLGLSLLGLLGAVGVDVAAAWLYAAVLVGLGAAGLASSRPRQA